MAILHKNGIFGDFGQTFTAYISQNIELNRENVTESSKMDTMNKKWLLLPRNTRVGS